MHRLRRADVVFIAAIGLVIAVGLIWPALGPWVFFLVAIPAVIIWAQVRGVAGSLRGDGSLSARAERKTAQYLTDRRTSGEGLDQ